jgi:alkylation response protein AidB-like acyl-CoA dehydrogenase
LGTGGGWRLSGEKSFVIDGHTADKIVVTARTTEGIGVFVIDGGAEGVSRSALKTLDQTRRLARVTLSDSPGRLLASPADGWELAEHALRHGAACLAMESVGGAQRTLDMAVDYVRTREQFGRTIGSFQAIKHRCADLLVRVESARSAAYHSIRASAEGAEDFPLVASLAKAYCTDVYFAAAVENIQLHGGIGFTWEHPAHLYFRRAKSSQLLLGNSSHHRDIVAYHSGI